MSRGITRNRQRLLDDLLPRLLRRPGAQPITTAEITSLIIDQDGRLPCTLVDVRTWLLDHPALVEWTDLGWIARRPSSIAETSA